MATSVAPPRTGRSALGIFFKIMLALVLLAVLAVAGGFAWFYRAAHVSLAQLDGTITVPGLAAPVAVIRDSHGVPHLTAASLEDVFFAQGYITAQDRLWQMDITRRAGGGELSEILGAVKLPSPPARSSGAPRPTTTLVDYDKTQRILRLRAVAERVAAQLPERDKMIFSAYARGVNAYIDQNRDHLPIEFHILRYQPRSWSVADSVLVAISMSQLLNPQYGMEYWREKIGEKLSPELMADLYPFSSPRDHPPGQDSTSAPGWQWEQIEEIIDAVPPSDRQRSRVRAYASMDPCEACLPGSNNWVVSGAHTTTGKPLLSNDMHLPHRVPGVWYELQLHSGEFNVEGFTLPGMPLVVVGHNQRIAWGFTNLNPDVQDLFVENFNDAGEYQTPSGWQKPESDHEVIHVKDEPDVALDVEVTRHGPIISELFPGETRKLALGWLIYDTSSINIPLFDVDSAQNWQEFRAAFAKFPTPSQNVVYGDVDGNIGYQSMGFVPIRASGDGTLPVSGADGKHDWTGYLPFDKLPSVYNPPSGIIATANAKITPDGYPYLLATQWFSPYRTERIYQVLEEPGKKFSPGDMLALQTDITSNYDRFFAESFVAAIDHNNKSSARAKEAAGIMRAFDGFMATRSAAATIEVKSRQALWEILLEPKLGPDWPRYEWSESSVALENIVRHRPERWLAPGYANFDELLTAAVESAIKDAPSDLKSWQYGQTFPVEISHTVLAAVPGLKHWAGPGRQPQSGGSFTVKQVGRTFGPSERMTVDFSNLDASTFNLVLGESGQPFSPYYMDHWPAWYGNSTFTLAYSDAAVQRTKAHELVLKPANSN